MSDAHESASPPDVVATASRYRDRLVAEIEKVDEFLQTACAFCTVEGEEAAGLWPLDDAGASRTIH